MSSPKTSRSLLEPWSPPQLEDSWKICSLRPHRAPQQLHFPGVSASWGLQFPRVSFLPSLLSVTLPICPFPTVHPTTFAEMQPPTSCSHRPGCVSRFLQEKQSQTNTMDNTINSPTGPSTLASNLSLLP